MEAQGLYRGVDVVGVVGFLECSPWEGTPFDGLG